MRWSDRGSGRWLPLLLAFLAWPAAVAWAGDKEKFEAIFDQAATLQGQRRFAAAAALFEQSLELATKLFGPDSYTVGATLNNLANNEIEFGEFAKAEAHYTRCLKIFEAQFGPNRLEVGETVENLGVLYRSMGDHAKAEPYFQRALKIYEATNGPNDLKVAKCLERYGISREEAGAYEQAAALLLRGARIRERALGPNHLDVAQSLNDLGCLYREMGQLAQADAALRRSLEIREATLNPHDLVIAQTLNNLSNVCFDLGQYEKSEQLLLRAIKIDESQAAPDELWMVDSLCNLANTYMRLADRYKEAGPLYLRCFNILENKLGPDHPKVASSLHSLGGYYNVMGEYAKAEEHYRRSLRITESRLGPDHPSVARTLNDLGVLCLKQRQYDAAEPLYQRSLKIHETAEGPNHPSVANVLNSVGLLHAAKGQLQQAAADVQRERRIVRRHVAGVLPTLSEQEQLAFLETSDRQYWDIALSIGRVGAKDPAIVNQSAGWLINGKAVAHETLAERAMLARDEQDPAVSKMVRALRDLRSRLAGLSQTPPASGQEAEHLQRITELARQEQELSRQISLAAGRATLSDPWVEVDGVRAALGDGETLVDIARFSPAILGAAGSDRKYWDPARYVAWIVPPAGKGDITIVDLGEAEAIEAAVNRVRSGVAEAMGSGGKPGLIVEQGEADAAAALEKPLAELAALTLTPILKATGDARQLVLSPDAALWLVPWGMLPLSDGRFAIEDYKIRYLVTARDLVKLANNKTKLGRPMMMADPNFDLGPAEAQAATRAVLRGAAAPERELAARGLSRAGSLIGVAQRLPGTAAEAKAIAPKLAVFAHAEPTIYSDRYALEGVFKALQRPQVLVMSTHGFFLADQDAPPQNGPTAATPGETRGAAQSADGQPLENPLLRCGLLLAGCNRRDQTTDGNDGVLTGMEIVGADLRGTELVVLSACETGLGQVQNGEGVAGLRQAFQLAGAQAVVATLWQIPDRESAKLMSDFFANLAAGQSKADALRSAQLAMIEQRREKHNAAHPFFWAAFTLTGN